MTHSNGTNHVDRATGARANDGSEAPDDPTEIDTLAEELERSAPAGLDIGGELLQGRLLRDLFGADAEEVEIGQYVIEARLGRGGMGEVYAGRDPLAGHEVAIKLLRPTSDRRAERALLLREARALAKLNHPNVVRLYHIGEHDGRLFIAMERVRGQTLAQWQRGDPPLSDLLQVYAKAARGLAAAHRAGVVHRDFKPSNVLVADDGRVLVSDFGVASVLDEAAGGFDRSLALASSGAGTLCYMAPEQVFERMVGPKSDQFSFFTALFEAVYRTRPFAATTAAQLLQQLEDCRVAPPSGNHRVPRRLARAFARGLSRRPEQRFEDMDAVADMLERGRLWWPIGVSGALLAAALLVSIGRPTTDTISAPMDPLSLAWSEDRQAAVRDARTLAGPVLWTELDGWARQWQLERAGVAPESDTARCLTDALVRFDVVVDRIAPADERRTVSNRAAFAAVDALPSPRGCVGSRVAPPADLSETERETLSVTLANAQLARIEHDFDESLRLAQLAYDAASEAGWIGAQIDALGIQGLAQLGGGDRLAAVGSLRQASSQALRHGDDTRAAALELELALAQDESDSDQARAELLHFADALVERSGSDDRLRAQLAIAHARDRMFAREPADAERILAAAIDELRDRDLEPYLEIELRRRHADAIAAQGRPDDAMQAYERTIARARTRLGDGFPDTVERSKLWANWAREAFVHGDLGLARELYQRVYDLRRATLPEDHPMIVGALTHLACVEIADEDYDAALADAERALALLERARVTPHERSYVYEITAKVHEARGQWRTAQAYLDLAIASLAEGQSTTRLEIERAHVIGKLGHSKDAIAAFAAALPDFEQEVLAEGDERLLVDTWVAWLKLLGSGKNPQLVAGEIERISRFGDLGDTAIARLEAELPGDVQAHSSRPQEP